MGNQHPQPQPRRIDYGGRVVEAPSNIFSRLLEKLRFNILSRLTLRDAVIARSSSARTPRRIDYGDMVEEDPSDIFSRLPEKLLCNILSRLSLRDGVKVKSVSRRWKNLWDSKPPTELEFTWTSMFLTRENQEYWNDSQCPCLDYRKRFVRAVGQFLKSYKGTEVYSVKIQFCLGQSVSHLDDWILMARKRIGAKVLFLGLKCPKNCERTAYHCQGYVFQKSMLRCEGSKLEALILDSMEAFRSICLPKLLSYRVSGSLFLSLLELKLSNCMLPSTISLGSLVHLMELVIFMCLGISRIKLSNPKMAILTCVNVRAIAMNYEGAPNLLDLRISFDILEQHALSRSAQRLPNLKQLRLHTYFWGDCESLTRSIKDWSTVTCLVLILKQPRGFCILRIAKLLCAFPSLEELKLLLRCENDQGFLEDMPSGDGAPKQLKEIELSGFYGTTQQIAFATFLLKHATSLKKLIINRSSSNLNELLLDRCPDHIDRSDPTERRSWVKGERDRIYSRLSLANKAGVELKVVE